ncbi:MAG: hypothetical protein M3P18_13675 [Actinomycetota bacterium]|nr:hypothetical protein [Actinomycetota bacterium]
MPFPDESFTHQVNVVPYRESWAVREHGLWPLARASSRFLSVEHIDPSDAKRLAGQLVKITMVRPGDGVEASYPLRLKGGLEGYSNMLAAGESCVEARVYFFRGAEQGAAIETSCQLEDS